MILLKIDLENSHLTLFRPGDLRAKKSPLPPKYLIQERSCIVIKLGSSVD